MIIPWQGNHGAYWLQSEGTTSNWCSRIGLSGHILIVTHFPDMPGCLSSSICLHLIGRLGRRRAPNPNSQNSLALLRLLTHESIEPASNRLHSPIHTLNDDALLNIFYLYRLDIPDEYDVDDILIGSWGGQRWWYKLAQVC